MEKQLAYISNDQYSGHSNKNRGKLEHRVFKTERRAQHMLKLQFMASRFCACNVQQKPQIRDLDDPKNQNNEAARHVDKYSPFPRHISTGERITQDVKFASGRFSERAI